MQIWTRRAYDPPSPVDGTRILVDRAWPRGVAKAGARLDRWDRDIAPSTALRRWFGHDPARWAEFKARYFAELDARPEALAALRRATREGRVTLVYGARDEHRNNAVALREYLLREGG
jgi:uncharacterized protein YeaO (DUF488 family)